MIINFILLKNCEVVVVTSTLCFRFSRTPSRHWNVKHTKVLYMHIKYVYIADL